MNRANNPPKEPHYFDEDDDDLTSCHLHVQQHDTLSAVHCPVKQLDKFDGFAPMKLQTPKS